jgi:hypothetical protein
MLSQKQGCQMIYFHTQKSPFGYIFESLGKKNVGIFYSHLINSGKLYCRPVCFAAICNILSRSGMLCDKSGIPGLQKDLTIRLKSKVFVNEVRKRNPVI